MQIDVDADFVGQLAFPQADTIAVGAARLVPAKAGIERLFSFLNLRAKPLVN